MDEKWWLVEGVVVKTDSGEFKELVSYKGEFGYKIHGTYSGTMIVTELDNCRPIGVPFDCMPEWATKIRFALDGDFVFLPESITDEIICTHDFRNCPYGLKGKTLPITDELKQLIFG